MKNNKQTLRKLTREELIQGTKYITQIQLKSIPNTAIDIRPLNTAEVQTYQELTVTGMPKVRMGIGGRRDTQTEIDIVQSTRSTAEAQLWAVATSLSIPDKTPYTPEDVKTFRGDIFKEIWEAVSELSGLKEDVEKQVDQFH